MTNEFGQHFWKLNVDDLVDRLKTRWYVERDFRAELLGEVHKIESGRKTPTEEEKK